MVAGYCPLGTPSLLNGDFLENVARLKDFSWSVFFSSDPTHTEPSIGSVVLHFFKDHPLEFLENSFVVLLVFFLYTAIYACICKAIVACIKIELTRNLVVSVITFGAVWFASFTALLVVHRQIPDTALLIINLVFYHVFVPYYVIQKKCYDLIPSIKSYMGFGNTPLRISFLVISVLVFFFTPSIAHHGDECPKRVLRAFSELFFYCTFGYIFLSYRMLDYMIYNHQSDVFYIYEKTGFRNYKKVIGQEKKKEGFGWIKNYYSENEEPYIVTQ